MVPDQILRILNIANRRVKSPLIKIGKAFICWTILGIEAEKEGELKSLQSQRVNEGLSACRA